jgi:hypothetical protein
VEHCLSGHAEVSGWEAANVGTLAQTGNSPKC